MDFLAYNKLTSKKIWYKIVGDTVYCCDYYQRKEFTINLITFLVYYEKIVSKFSK